MSGHRLKAALFQSIIGPLLVALASVTVNTANWATNVGSERGEVNCYPESASLQKMANASWTGTYI